MSLQETARDLDKAAGVLPLKFSSDRTFWTQQWYWRPSQTSYNGLEAVWVTSVPRGSHDFAEARVFLANSGPYRGQWRAYVSTPDSLQSVNLKDTAVGTFSSHRDAMASVNHFIKAHFEWRANQMQLMRVGTRR